MTTTELIEAIRALVIKHRAVHGYVGEHHSIDRSGDSVYYGAQVWFSMAHRAGVDDDNVCSHGRATPDAALAEIVAGIAKRRVVDPIKTRAVMDDELDEDPVDEVSP